MYRCQSLKDENGFQQLVLDLGNSFFIWLSYCVKQSILDGPLLISEIFLTLEQHYLPTIFLCTNTILIKCASTVKKG